MGEGQTKTKERTSLSLFSLQGKWETMAWVDFKEGYEEKKGKRGQFHILCKKHCEILRNSKDKIKETEKNSWKK